MATQNQYFFSYTNMHIAFPTTYIILDLETTGLRPTSEQIIEINADKYENEVKIESFHK